MTTTAPQVLARIVLAAVHIDVPEHHTVVLTDTADTGTIGNTLQLNPGQIEAAVNQYYLVTGETIDADQLVDSLPWANEGAA